MQNTNRTILVTGSNSGIGLGVATHYYETGANVVLHGRDEGKLERAQDHFTDSERVAVVVGDIASLEVANTLADEAVRHFGGIDLLVNSAGIFGSRPFVDVTEKELDRYLLGNLKGTYLVTQAAVRHMLTANGGNVVNIGTVLVDHALAGLPASAPLASKGGIHALTVNLAAELSTVNVRVNAVAPGIVRTPLHDGQTVDELGSLALLHRIGEVEEIVAAVQYLDSAEFVTGHILNVDGGFVSGRQ